MNVPQVPEYILRLERRGEERSGREERKGEERGKNRRRGEKSNIKDKKKERKAKEGKEEKMKGQMDVCCNREWGGERGRLAGMMLASKCMRH